MALIHLERNTSSAIKLANTAKLGNKWSLRMETNLVSNEKTTINQQNLGARPTNCTLHRTQRGGNQFRAL